MEHVARTSEFDVWLDTLYRPFTFHSPFQGDDFALMLVINDVTINEVERSALSTEIVRQGCRFAVSTGHECSAWDDALDWAFIGTDPNYAPPDDRFVMTSWHENEHVAEVVEFFRCHTAFNDFTPVNFLVVFLGVCRAVEVEARRAVAKFFGTVDQDSTDLG